MALYRYVKAQPEAVKPRPPARPGSRILRYLGRGLLLVGAAIVANVLWPFLTYELFTAPTLRRTIPVSPIPVGAEDVGEIEGDVDLTLPKNWFPQAEYEPTPGGETIEYTLSIPRQRIDQARVVVGGEDLKKSLVQFSGSALPGKLGATVIFGHSILPQFFNPKNYLSIFSLIPELEFGDEILLQYDGVTYTYRVIDKEEVSPTNLSVLEQPFDNEYLRLITCTPPGTYLRRGVITATLVD